MNSASKSCIILLLLVGFITIVHPIDISGKLSIENMPYRLELTETHEGDGVLAVDLDNDGSDEIITFVNYTIRKPSSKTPNSLFLYNSGWELIDQTPFAGTILRVKALQLDDDSNRELVVVEEREERTFLNILDHPGGKRVSTFQPIEPVIQIAGTVDVDSDGKKEIVAVASAGYEKYPRVVYAYDWVSGEILWQYEMGSYPQYVSIADLNDDGNEDIIITTSAPGNGANRNGTDDYHSYLLILNSQGELLYQREMGKVYSGCIHQLLDVNGDSDMEIVTLSSGFPADKPRPSKMAIWDWTAGLSLLRQTEVEAKLSQLVLADVDNDGVEEIIVGEEKAGIHVYDRELYLIKSSLDNDFTHFGLVADFNNDRVPELTIQSFADNTIILDNSLKPIVAFNASVTFYSVSPGFGEDRFILLTHNGSVSRVELVRNMAGLFSRLDRAWIGFFFAMLVILTTMGVYLSRRRKQDMNKVPSYTLAWASLAQELAHRIRTPLSSLRLAAQDLKLEQEKKSLNGKKIKDYTDHMLTEVDQISAMTKAMLKFSKVREPILEPHNVNDIINGMLDDYRSYRDVTFEKEFDSELPAIPIDLELIKMVFQNLINNSLDAMEEKGVIRITIYPTKSVPGGSGKKNQGGLIVEIKDTGKGIEREDLKHLFEPYFSRSSEGTGIGLTIVKRIMEDHCGEVDVSSKPGVGTMMRLKFPVGK